MSINNVFNDYIKAIPEMPTSFHTAKYFSDMLEEKGYTRLYETEHWNLEKNKKYYVLRNDSAIIAFKIPDGFPSSLMMCCTHSDSPSLKVKYNAEILGTNYIRINTEKYGGMIMSTWLDRPLSVAGRVVYETEDGIQTKLVNVDKDLLVIPNVAIHMNSNINNGYMYNPAIDMVPLFASAEGKDGFIREIAEAANIDADTILDYELFTYNRQPPAVFGKDGEYFSAPGIDDKMCAFASFTAFCAAEDTDALVINCIFDNEETGSLSKQGADSDFMTSTLERICTALYNGTETMMELCASGLMVSADNAHGLHPNHPEFSDPNLKPVLNGGVVIKYNSSLKYISDSISASTFERICKKAKVPVQRYANRSDLAGGSTLGALAIRHMSINAVDIGCAQLAMHSSYETAGSKDMLYVTKALKTFFETTLSVEKDVKISVK